MTTQRKIRKIISEKYFWGKTNRESWLCAGIFSLTTI
jgi:hypothetical protein